MSLPELRFPKEYDGEDNLFRAVDSLQSQLSEHLKVSDTIIHLLPQKKKLEDWPASGFATIGKELVYYKNVIKNSNDRVVALSDVQRNIDENGEDHILPKGTRVVANVVSQHHNFLSQAIINTEDFIGFQFDPRPETLDWRIRNLAELDLLRDDHGCPDVDFRWNLGESTAQGGIIARYDIQIQQTGTGGITFQLSFGDGQLTRTNLSGEHVYAPNATIDPVLRIGNRLCETVITPITRENPLEPEVFESTPFTIPIPDLPIIPDFTPIEPTYPEPELNLPPTIFPCPGDNGGDVNVSGPTLPSTISIVGPTIPSVVSYVGPSSIVIVGPNFPSTIPPSTIPPSALGFVEQNIVDRDTEQDDQTPHSKSLSEELGSDFQDLLEEMERFQNQSQKADTSLKDDYGEEFKKLFDEIGSQSEKD